MSLHDKGWFVLIVCVAWGGTAIAVCLAVWVTKSAMPLWAMALPAMATSDISNMFTRAAS